jgi:hypothetical protein
MLRRGLSTAAASVSRASDRILLNGLTFHAYHGALPEARLPASPPYHIYMRSSAHRFKRCDAGALSRSEIFC